MAQLATGPQRQPSSEVFGRLQQQAPLISLALTRARSAEHMPAVSMISWSPPALPVQRGTLVAQTSQSSLLAPNREELSFAWNSQSQSKLQTLRNPSPARMTAPVLAMGFGSTRPITQTGPWTQRVQAPAQQLLHQQLQHQQPQHQQPVHMQQTQPVQMMPRAMSPRTAPHQSPFIGRSGTPMKEKVSAANIPQPLRPQIQPQPTTLFVEPITSPRQSQTWLGRPQSLGAAFPVVVGGGGSGHYLPGGSGTYPANSFTPPIDAKAITWVTQNTSQTPRHPSPPPRQIEAQRRQTVHLPDQENRSPDGARSTRPQSRPSDLASSLPVQAFWNPFEQLAEAASSPGLKTSPSPPPSSLRDTMGVFGLPEPPTPTAATTKVGQGPTTSRPSLGISPCASSPEAQDMISFVLANPQAQSPGSRPSSLTPRANLWEDFNLHSRMPLQNPAPDAPPSPPQRLTSNTSGLSVSTLDLASVPSAMPVSSSTSTITPRTGIKSSTPSVVEPLSSPRPENVRPLQPRVKALPGNTEQSELIKPLTLGGGRSEKKMQTLSQPTPEASVVPFSSPPAVVNAHEASSSATSLRSQTRLQAAAAQVTLRDLSELRSFRNPPAVVCQVLEAVALILGVSDYRWASMRKQLDSNFLARIASVDITTIGDVSRDKLLVLLQVPTFSDGSLLERCSAVAALAAWCNAVGYELEAGPMRNLDAGHAMVTSSDLGGLKVEPDLWQLSQDELTRVKNLTVTREGVGSVTFHGTTDCRELVHTISEVVVLNPGEVVIYPNQKQKPAPGHGLNKASSITLHGCLPKSQCFKDVRAREKYKARVKAMTQEKGAEFIDYDCDLGVWQFRVAHF
jgi:hypothetical protein